MMGKGETILVADDEPAVLAMICAVLHKLGYKVLPAENGEEAVDIYHRNAASIDMLILDVMMPKLSGTEAAMQIRAIHPDIPLIFSSGYSDDKRRAELQRLSNYGVVYKPIRITQLGESVREYFNCTN